MMAIKRSEIAAEAWRQRYIADRCEIEEMEAGIARALAGECSDEEWGQLCREGQFGQRMPQSLEAVDSILKAVYQGSVRR